MRAKDTAIISTCLLLNSFIQGQEIGNTRDHEDDNPHRRILFGSQANPNDFPFLVALYFGVKLCAGTIIANEWIMTAAHCVFGEQCYTIKIIPATWPYGNSLNPIQCFVHPRYVSNYFAYDIALLRVQAGRLNDGLTRTIPLPMPGTYHAPGTPALVVGWGQTQEAIYPNILLRANVRVEDWNVCNRKFKENDFECLSNPNCIPGDMPIRVLCTQGYSSASPGTCFGDSGGPVVIDGCVAGVVSFVLKDGDHCKIGAPSMHVSVVDYIPWILSIADPNMDTSGVQTRAEHYKR